MHDFVRPDHRLEQLLKHFESADDEPVSSLSNLKREIHQYGKRRCDVEASRDNLVYYLGFAFEANHALDLDSLAITGLLSLPMEAFAAIFQGEDEELPPLLTDYLRYALEQPAVLEWARAKGTWLQWRRLEVLYREAVDDFLNSNAFHRPGWRKRTITRAQHYLIGEICRLSDLKIPALATRGQAFEFIRRHGGNPRFWIEPPIPEAWWEDAQ